MSHKPQKMRLGGGWEVGLSAQASVLWWQLYTRYGDLHGSRVPEVANQNAEGCRDAAAPLTQEEIRQRLILNRKLIEEAKNR